MAVTQLKKDKFDEAIQEKGKLVVIDFFATWCGPCKVLSPVVDQASEEFTDVAFYKVDIDEEMELAQRYQVMSVPTVLFIKEGEVVNKSVGSIPIERLRDLINEAK
ncbi:thioredoxin [Blautia liquoris]|uniref:Thioredoxin n=1 Tax=Blautia liquoris TaxID=2779518 RepID=A0A7M2RHM7_9FIRM|nr:thioredoxin [Blautia liquoris]QOV19638.1 thioredoxin [Blautia liquoris]